MTQAVNYINIVATESLCFLFAIFSSVNVSHLKIDSPVSCGEQWKEIKYVSFASSPLEEQ